MSTMEGHKGVSFKDYSIGPKLKARWVCGADSSHWYRTKVDRHERLVKQDCWTFQHIESSSLSGKIEGNQDLSSAVHGFKQQVRSTSSPRISGT